MNADVLTTRVADGIAVVTLGSARRIYMDDEMGVALTEALDGFAGDAKRQGSRSRDGDCAAAVVIPAGIGCLHQASRPQRHRDAAGSGTGARTKSFPEIVHDRTCA